MRRRHRPTKAPNRRHDIRFPVANTEIHNHSIRCRVLDLHSGGMAIESTEALAPGGRYTFTLTIGDHIESLEARVLWCRLLATRRLGEGEVQPLYRAGVARVRPEDPDHPGPSRPSPPPTESTPSSDR